MPSVSPQSYGGAISDVADGDSTFRSADTWAMGRGPHQFVVPHWEQVAAGNPPAVGGPITPARQEFADLPAASHAAGGPGVSGH